jgi:hypothetical protein
MVLSRIFAMYLDGKRAQVVEGLPLFEGHLRPLGPRTSQEPSPAPHFGNVPHSLTLPIVKNEAKVFIELINISKSQGI